MLRVLKLLVFLARGEKYNSAVWTSLLCAVTSLYVVNQRSFLTSVVHLPSEDQSFVKELLKSAVPQLNSDLNTLVKGRTTTLTNPLEVKVPETTFSRIIASRFARKYEEDYFSSPKVMASPVKRDHGRVPSENIPLKERPAFFRERRNRPIQASAFDSSLSSRACGVARTNADEPWEGEAQATQDVPSARWCLDQLRGAYSAQEKCTQLTCLEQILWDPKKWGEGCESSFVHIIDRLGKESTEPNHNVRELAFVCLRSFASVRAMHKCVGRHLYKIVTLCVAGMDDCFIEVQQAAANALHAVIGTFESTSSYDALIAAFCAVLSDWQSGRDYNDGSKGRCEVILSIGRLFESMNASLENKKEFVSVKQNVLKTLVDVLTPCLSHCAPRVQESAFLVLSIMWFLFDTNVLPLFRTLSASQKTLLSFFYNKHYAKGVPSTFVDLKEELEKLGCA
ncbi:hypothetical protein ADEAN_000380800 [Angomonas deanei]|uniref:Uncharacterized protein n=1 Tax=Angomonas deanei TaxID=59799 RepID=A0A7G2C9D8_9TRYP|nr:hypothetical protein ADEAN_000380800 [Angomonas deanei]